MSRQRKAASDRRRESGARRPPYERESWKPRSCALEVIAKRRRARRGAAPAKYAGLLLAIAFAAAAPAPLYGAAAASNSPPNILYVLADQWRAAATGYAGDPNVKTPHLDRLAKESINFRNAVSVCPVCTPYRACLLTGRYPTTTGMFLNDLYLPEQELCMAEIFAEAGYDTGYIGKWHLDGHGRDAYIPPRRRQGFDYWKAAECTHNYNHSLYYSGASPEKQFWDGYDAYAQTNDAVRAMRARAKGGRPFLLMISYGPPHFPHASAPQDLKDLYAPESLKLPPNIPEELRADARRELQGYYAHCTALDRCVGRLLETLQDTGLAENTLLVFTSDHGEMMGAHGRLPCLKQYPFDESIRIPFLLRFPAIHGGRGRTINAPINTPDILPTLLALCGVPIPNTVEGEDLSRMVRLPDADADRAALIMSVSPFSRNHSMPEYRGVRTARYTYVCNTEGPWLLYDNETDPWQMTNLANQPAFTDLQSDLQRRLQDKLGQIGDRMRPREFYLKKWNYRVDPRGIIPYNGQVDRQGPSLNRKE